MEMPTLIKEKTCFFQDIARINSPLSLKTRVNF